MHNPCPHVISRRLSESGKAGTSGTWFLQTLGAVPLFTCGCGWDCDQVWLCNHIKPNGFTFIRVRWMLPSCLDFSEYQSISVCVRIAVYVLVPTHAHRRVLLFLEFSTAGWRWYSNYLNLAISFWDGGPSNIQFQAIVDVTKDPLMISFWGSAAYWEWGRRYLYQCQFGKYSTSQGPQSSFI